MYISYVFLSSFRSIVPIHKPWMILLVKGVLLWVEICLRVCVHGWHQKPHTLTATPLHTTIRQGKWYLLIQKVILGWSISTVLQENYGFLQKIAACAISDIANIYCFNRQYSAGILGQSMLLISKTSISDIMCETFTIIKPTFYPDGPASLGSTHIPAQPCNCWQAFPRTARGANFYSCRSKSTQPLVPALQCSYQTFHTCTGIETACCLNACFLFFLFFLIKKTKQHQLYKRMFHEHCLIS